MTVLPEAEGRSFDTADLHTLLADMVADERYPCLGAKSVFRRDRANVLLLDRLDDPDATAELYQALADFSAEHPAQADEAGWASFLVAFRAPIPATEEEFEELLWRQLGRLREIDPVAGDPTVSPDPANPHFAFSVAGRAFFIVGMHPAASRVARRMAGRHE